MEITFTLDSAQFAQLLVDSAINGMNSILFFFTSFTAYDFALFMVYFTVLIIVRRFLEISKII